MWVVPSRQASNVVSAVMAPGTVPLYVLSWVLMLGGVAAVAGGVAGRLPGVVWYPVAIALVMTALPLGLYPSTYRRATDEQVEEIRRGEVWHCTGRSVPVGDVLRLDPRYRRGRRRGKVMLRHLRPPQRAVFVFSQQPSDVLLLGNVGRRQRVWLYRLDGADLPRELHVRGTAVAAVQPVRLRVLGREEVSATPAADL